MNDSMKKIFGYFILSFSLILVLIPLFRIQAKPLQESKKIRVGYYVLDGYHNFDKNGNRSGYGYDYLQEIANYTGWSYEYVGGTLNTCIQNLKNGNIDLLSNVQYSDELAEVFDYSSQSIGTSYGTLSVRSDNTTYALEDYDSFNGMNVGILSGDYHNAQFSAFCQEHNLKISTVLFFDAGVMEKALQAGKVDGVVKSNFLKKENEKIIAQFNTRPFYFVVKKGNTELLQQLNKAISEITTNNPGIEYHLYEKYYASERTALSLTKEEEDFLKKKGTIKVVSSPGTFPLISQYENGQKGIFIDIINLMSKDLDISMEIIPTNSYNESLQKIRNGEADIILDIDHNYSWAEENHVDLTTPYLSMPISMVTRDEPLSENPSIAIVDGYIFSNRDVQTLYPGSKIVRHESSQEALDAVNDGEQDITYVSSYLYQRQKLDRKYQKLTSDFSNSFNTDISMGINENQEKIFTIILNKELGYIGNEQIQSIVRQNTLIESKPTTISDLFYDHPKPFLASIGVLFFGVIGILAFYSKSKLNSEKRMEILAYGDELTGLKNRHWLEKNSHSLLLSDRYTQYAMISFDINRFDIINECYGRETGYEIIRNIAEGLKSFQSEGVIAVRSKNDNFLCLLPYNTKEDLLRWINQIKRNYSSFQSEDKNILITMNFGVFMIPDGKADITSAIDNADTARHEAEVAPNAIVFYDDEMRDRLALEKAIENIQERALKDGEFQVYYQPKFDIRDDTLTGAEALIRWSSMDKGFMVPSQFVPLFEKNGFIIQLDFFVMEEVCKMIRKRMDSNQKIVPISINQSRAHLTQSQYVQQLRDMVQKYNIPPKLIELELTETAFSDAAAAKEILNQMKKIGFLTSIDDFGSGYSSLTLLNDIPLDILKIDKYFLTKSEDSERTRLIIEKIVEMAKLLKVIVICEGVEKQKHIDFLKQVGCYFAQGYFYSKPISQKSFESKLDDNTWNKQ